LRRSPERARRPSSVGGLADEFPVSRPAVSQHLKVLKDAGLVRLRAEGARRIYSIDPAGLAATREYLEAFWRVSLDAFRDAANRAHRTDQEEG
jgi:DNA-binding transcriptional ArsR family regulator